MGEATGIEWTNDTWNPWVGCTKVSPGCAHCYAERLMSRGFAGGGPFREVRRTGKSTFNSPRHWERRLAAGTYMDREGRFHRRRMVFTCSMSDYFHEAADGWRYEAWRIIKETPHLTYQILTKRPERVAANLPPDWGPNGYPNVWLGTSGETIEYARERAAHLLPIPAAVHFLSAEPWLEAPVVSELHPKERLEYYVGSIGAFDWVILGGESGPACRPFDLDSARLVRDACKATGTPFFLKQLGGHPDPRAHDKAVLDGERWVQFPDA